MAIKLTIGDVAPTRQRADAGSASNGRAEPDDRIESDDSQELSSDAQRSENSDGDGDVAPDASDSGVQNFMRAGPGLKVGKQPAKRQISSLPKQKQLVKNTLMWLSGSSERLWVNAI